MAGHGGEVNNDRVVEGPVGRSGGPVGGPTHWEVDSFTPGSRTHHKSPGHEWAVRPAIMVDDTSSQTTRTRDGSLTNRSNAVTMSTQRPKRQASIHVAMGQCLDM